MSITFRLNLNTLEFQKVSAIELDKIHRYCIENYFQDQYDYHEIFNLARMIHRLNLSELALNIILNQFQEETSEQSYQSGQESMRLAYCD